MSVLPCRPRTRPAGFTLIEVIAALVIFALGVLMVIQLNTSLSQQMAYAAKSSAIVVLAHERLDSLEALPFESLTVGTRADTVSVEGKPYRRTATIGLITAILYSVDVEVSPVTPGDGPSYSANSYAARPW